MGGELLTWKGSRSDRLRVDGGERSVVGLFKELGGSSDGQNESAFSVGKVKKLKNQQSPNCFLASRTGERGPQLN